MNTLCSYLSSTQWIRVAALHFVFTLRAADSQRVLAGPQADYGMMIFADMRYQRHHKRDKLPAWITSHLKDAHLNLSTDMLLHVARQFMRSMGQPYNRLDVGKSLLTEAQVNSMDAARMPAAADGTVG